MSDTEITLSELSNRFNVFEEHLAKLGIDVSAITAMFYNYLNASQPYRINTFGWKPINMRGRFGDIEELVASNIMAWNRVLKPTTENTPNQN